MDHLPPISDPAFLREYIPYLGQMCRYDGRDFKTFLSRQGWKIEDTSSDLEPLVRADGSPGIVRESTAFLQAWLFFGMLAEFFHHVNVEVKLDEFVSSENARYQVTTKQLPTYLERFQAQEFMEPIEVQRAHLETVLLFLHYTGDLVDRIFPFHRLLHQPDEESLQKLVIAEAIAMLGDSFMNAAKLVWAHLEDDLRRIEEPRIRKSLRFSEPATLSIKRLEQLGWCKSDRIMLHRLVDTTGLYYVAQLKRLMMQTSHIKCSMYECMEMQIDPKTYTSKHTSNDCSCPVIFIDVDKIVNTINSGRIPCIKISPAPDGNSCNLIVEVVDSSEGFVAFSHVWAHGLGNPAGNALPRCQLLRLQGLVNEVCRKRRMACADTAENLNNQTTAPKSEESLTAFWLDTLCIPVGREHAHPRNLAILSLTEIFTHGSTVLVVDAELQEVSVEALSLEKEMRLITCGWSRRVWTLQEALLARRDNLYWQFKEEALSVSEIWEDKPVKSPHDISYRMSALEKRTPKLIVNPENESNLSNDFLDLMYALRYRSVSRVEDESICIAPILGLGRKELLTTKDPVQRMKIFLSLWKRIPSYFLFFEGPRIEQEGYGWMPRSFIDGIHKSTALRAPENFTTFDSQGIRVSYPGLLVSATQYSYLRFDTGFCNSLDGLWYTIRDHGVIVESRLPPKQRWANWRQALHLVQRPAIVLEYPSNYSHNYIIAVLVDITGESQGTFYARYLCRVWLNHCDRDTDLEMRSSSTDTQDSIREAYLARISQIPVEEQAVLRDCFPPPLDMVQATAITQKWCIG